MSTNSDVKSQKLHSGTGLGRILLAYIVICVIPIAFYVGPFYLTLLRVFLLIAIPYSVVKLTGDRNEKIVPADYLIGLYVIWTILSEFTNTGKYNLQEIGSNGVEIIGGYVVGRTYIKTTSQFVTLIRALVLAVAVLLPFSILEATTKTPMLQTVFHLIPGTTSNPIVTMEERLGLRRVQSVFPHPILYGIFCAIPFAGSLMLLRVEPKVRVPKVSVVVVALATFLSLSSGAILAVLMQAGLIAYNRAFKTKWKWLLLLGSATALIVFLNLASNRGAVKLFMSYATFSPHNAYYRATSNDWAWRNIIGDSENNIESAIMFGLRDASMWVRPDWLSGSLDNFWLATALKYGAPATIFLLLAIAVSVIRISRRDFSPDGFAERVRLSWSISMLSLCFSLYTVHIWGNVFSVLFFMLGAGQFLIRSTEGRSDELADLKEQSKASQKPQYRRTHSTSRTIEFTGTKNLSLPRGKARSHYF